MALTGFRKFLLVCCFGASALHIMRYESDPVANQPSAANVAAVVERPSKEPPREIETVAVDAVRQSSADVPLNGNPDPTESSASLGQGLDRNNLIAITMDEQDWWMADNLGGQMLGTGEEPRIANDASEPVASTQPNMKRHHGALTKPHKRKRIVRQAKGRKFAVQKRVKRGRRLAHAAPALTRIAKR